MTRRLVPRGKVGAGDLANQRRLNARDRDPASLVNNFALMHGRPMPRALLDQVCAIAARQELRHDVR